MEPARSGPDPRPHGLYRFFDVSGALLYIGITADIPTRIKRHGEEKPWWTEVARIAIEVFPDRESVLAAERRAIRTELPRWNIQHQPKPAAVIAPNPGLKIPCMKCGEPIGDKGAFYLPNKEMARHQQERAKEVEFKARKRAETGGGLVLYSLAEMMEYTPKAARWQVHCLPCMAPCYDHPDDEDDTGCGGAYWFDGDRADTWPKVVAWTTHLMEKNWLTDTNWGDVLNFLLQHNGQEGGSL